MVKLRFHNSVKPFVKWAGGKGQLLPQLDKCLPVGLENKDFTIVDCSTWKTKTPEASIRRIVQESKMFFRIQPGLWALEECRDEVLCKFELKIGDKRSEEQFSHGYYQGLLVEIGKFKHQKTYVPAQDQNRKFIDQRLGDISDTTELPSFTYEELLRKAKTIDVIWFNERNMPSDFYEVEHTTDVKNPFPNFTSCKISMPAFISWQMRAAKGNMRTSCTFRCFLR